MKENSIKTAPLRGVIELENMEFRAGHGCYELEKIVGNRFLVSLSIEVDMEEAARSDDITKSVNYLTVYELVREQMKISSDILENVANRILDNLYENFPQVECATVKISKMAPPLGGKVERVSVTLTK